ncbi:MAG: hypothetical protein ACRC5T_03575 [Cetobacterium sp.]
MNDNNARMLLIDEMLAEGIVAKTDTTLSYFSGGREYLVMVALVDITDWQKESDPTSDSSI